MKSKETKIRVRYQETDSMGVVYYANYLVWFEVGRTEYFRSLGMPYGEFEKNDLYLPAVEAFCHYRAPARYDDLLTVITRVSTFQEVRITFEYEIIRDSDGEVLTTGHSQHAFVNGRGRPVVLRKQNPFLWKRLTETTEETEN
ncbi:MAG: thioesterase family protein [Candidatus Contubernalis sp.]|nr:thioesterase family protein [Candidatus Contubernalis sp.]